MIRDCRSLLTAAFVVALTCAGAGSALAQRSFTTGAESWRIDHARFLSTTGWPAESVLKLSLTTPKDAPPANPNPRPDSPSTELPNLVFRSDHNSNIIGALDTADGHKIPLSIQRSVVFDSERRAIRVLDVIKSNEDIDRHIALTYTTRWQPESAKRIPTPRQFTIPGARESSSVAAGVMDNPKLPLLMFVYGNVSDAWKRKVAAGSESMHWTYQGVLPAKQRIVFLHWVVMTDDVKTETVRRVHESLVGADGMPKDGFIDDQTLKELANFPMMGKVRAVDGQPAVELPLLEDLAESYRITPSSDHDHLVLAGMPTLQGRFEAGGLKFISKGKEQALDLKDIAAIQGGAGTGRRTRVYFRDGNITSGQLSWEEGKFVSETVGVIKIDPESFDTVILRTNEAVDGRQAFAALWATPERDVSRLMEMPPGRVDLRWTGGTLNIGWKDITSLRQLAAPDLGQEVTLRDGSRLRGWVASSLPELGQCLAYATTWKGLMAALEQKDAAEPVAALYLHTTDDSRLTGEWQDKELVLATLHGEVRMPTSNILKVEATPGVNGEPIQLEVTSLTGSTIQGTAVLEVCSWKHQGQSMAVPWPLISEIVRPKPASANP